MWPKKSKRYEKSFHGAMATQPKKGNPSCKPFVHIKIAGFMDIYKYRVIYKYIMIYNYHYFNGNSRIQQMEVRKRTIFLAIFCWGYSLT